MTTKILCLSAARAYEHVDDEILEMITKAEFGTGKIFAIKELRRRSNCDLRDARAAIEYAMTYGIGHLIEVFVCMDAAGHWAFGVSADDAKESLYVEQDEDVELPIKIVKLATRMTAPKREIIELQPMVEEVTS